MFPILYDSVNVGVVPNHFGIGVLKDTLSCEVTEERNGSYELKLKYPSSGAYAKQLVPRAIIKAKPNYMDDPQLFRIYKVGKAIGSSFTIYARHISYDLSGFPITTGSATNIGDALTLLQNNANGFTFTTDKSTHANFKIYEPSSVRSWLGGKTGSLLDVFGTGEYKYDNFEVSLLSARGTNRGVTLRYGKNITKFENTNDSSNLATGILAYWKSSDNEDTTVISDTISTGLTLDITCVDIIDASSNFENEPTKAQLNNFVNNYIQQHELKNVKQNYKLDFVQISQMLKDRVDLCDTVNIIYDDYGISLNAKCISTTWDVLNERYSEIELGEPKTNIADTITSISKTLGEAMSGNEVRQAIKSATDLITGNKGGYIIMHDSDGDGEPDELLIMNTPDITTATKVWRWNLSGLGYSKNGYDGTFGLAMTMDGAIVADYIKTGNLVFGGNGNTDGKLEIRDTNGNIICRFDKTGADVKGNIHAQSFTADADNGISGEILTTDTQIDIVGYCSGLAFFKNGKVLSGVGVSKANHPTLRPCGVLYIRDLDHPLECGGIRQIQNATDDFFELFLYKFSDDGTTGNSAMFRYGKVGGVECGQMNLPGVNNLGMSTPSLSYFGQNNYLRLGYAYMQETTNGYGLHSLNVLSLRPTSSSTSKIYINGNDGNVQCVSLTQTSSEKYKKNIEDLTEEEAKKILELRPVNYDFKDEIQGTNMHGFIAEEVDKVIPSLVQHFEKPILDENGEQIDTTNEVALDYIMMIPYLTKMVQMQQEQINNLQKEIDKLKEGK